MDALIASTRPKERETVNDPTEIASYNAWVGGWNGYTKYWKGVDQFRAEERRRQDELGGYVLDCLSNPYVAGPLQIGGGLLEIGFGVVAFPNR